MFFDTGQNYIFQNPIIKISVSNINMLPIEINKINIQHRNNINYKNIHFGDKVIGRSIKSNKGKKIKGTVIEEPNGKSIKIITKNNIIKEIEYSTAKKLTNN